MSFFRKFGGGSLSEPPGYVERGQVDHVPVVLGQRVSAVGPQSCSLQDSQRPILSVKSIRRHGGKPFLYNAFDEALNPARLLHECSGARIELRLDTDVVYLPGIGDAASAGSAHDGMCAAPRCREDGELRHDFKGSLTGTLLLTVKTRSLVVKKLSLRLNGYSTELLCAADESMAGAKGEPRTQNKLLKNWGSGLPSYYTPFVSDEILGFDTFPTVLTTGTYVLPFRFVLDPIHHHASFRSVHGSTTYRLEALASLYPTQTLGKKMVPMGPGNVLPLPMDVVLPSDSAVRTVFLSQVCTVVKTLDSSCSLLHESVESHGSFNRGFLDYHFFLSSRIVEFDSPFQCGFDFIMGPGHVCSQVTISLVQNSFIPYGDVDCHTFSCDKHCKNTEIFQLVQYLPGLQPENSTQPSIIRANFDNLKLSSNSGSGFLGRVLFPYYCEESRLTHPNDPPDSVHAKLKIVHFLDIKITTTHANVRADGKSLNTHIRIPVILADKKMLSSMHLPAYEPYSASSKMAALSLSNEYPNENHDMYTSSDSSNPDSPPGYAANACH